LLPSLKINVFGSMPMLPIPGKPQSGVKFARASEAKFIGGEAGNPCKLRGKTPKCLNLFWKRIYFEQHGQIKD
jgi:hypothetical protein